jgi:hypothetical protein
MKTRNKSGDCCGDGWSLRADSGGGVIDPTLWAEGFRAFGLKKKAAHLELAVSRVFLLGVLILGAFLGTATADDAADKRAKELIHKLETEPEEARRKLIAEIRQEAAPRSKHPPVESSTRTDMLPVLEAALGNDDDRVRTEAICALCYMKCKDAFPILEKAFESRDPTVRYYASMGVEWLADEAELRPRVIAALAKACDRPGELLGVRLGAAAALAKIGVKQKADIFLDALRDPHENAALSSGVLADMGRKDAIELMIVRLRTARPSSDHWLAVALKRLTGEDFGKDADAWQKWLDANRSDLPVQIK